MALTLEQRLQWLETRIVELECWLHRDWVDLEDWSFDGQPIVLGGRWPERDGVRRMSHPRVEMPGESPDGERRLLLELGGEGLARLTCADGVEELLGLDIEHRWLPLRDAPFAVQVDIVARLPFGMPNRNPHLTLARAVLVDEPLERLVRRLRLVLETTGELKGHEVAGPCSTARPAPWRSCAGRARRGRTSRGRPRPTAAQRLGAARRAGFQAAAARRRRASLGDRRVRHARRRARAAAGALPRGRRARSHRPRSPRSGVALAARGNAAQGASTSRATGTRGTSTQPTATRGRS